MTDRWVCACSLLCYLIYAGAVCPPAHRAVIISAASFALFFVERDGDSNVIVMHACARMISIIQLSIIISASSYKSTGRSFFFFVHAFFFGIYSDI